MIRISLGNIGSGKTANEVREIFLNKSHRKIYSNIKTKIDHQININPSMIVHKEVSGQNKKGEDIHTLTLNKKFWMGIKDPISVVLDEAHSIMNPRRSMSKVNIILTDWMALIRRVLGQAESGYGELVLITQLERRLDVIAREMAIQVRYHVCHFNKYCKDCGCEWIENSEMSEGLWQCPTCARWGIKKYNHSIEVWHFGNMKEFSAWKNMGMKTFYKHYFVNDIENYFPLYNTLQWDDMFSELY